MIIGIVKNIPKFLKLKNIKTPKIKITVYVAIAIVQKYGAITLYFVLQLGHLKKRPDQCFIHIHEVILLLQFSHIIINQV